MLIVSIKVDIHIFLIIPGEGSQIYDLLDKMRGLIKFGKWMPMRLTLLKKN